ncbi:PepSY domain-containing protein [Streptacidiphilus jiangxiensis]|uniref:Peptidase propeptide and YPEB domain-containing protein n=1 Tax=Streptacidiphilus jiangxiensis TaxID=235985 RepID=A0A1H7I7E7_STRJI|nr:PepSY domain-containing protein [Streptacidiphilus jiangxiensis]SEK58348.1 Peptidase propeptide and YPEB domain-containing protein [Streptacidiphilus jiangxiensis]
MSDSLTPGREPDEPEENEDMATLPAPEPAPRRRGPVRRVVTGRRSRWVVGGVAAVVVVGGAVAATAAVVHHHDGFGERVAVAVGPDGLPGLKRIMVQAQGVPGGPGAVVVKNGQVIAVPGGFAAGGAVQLPTPGTDGASLAPAPLPSLSADQAVAKAEAAVTGGKVESLSSVPEQGGGSAWQAVVVGPDGVHHLVTLDGASGTVTSNTVQG